SERSEPGGGVRGSGSERSKPGGGVRGSGSERSEPGGGVRGSGSERSELGGGVEACVAVTILDGLVLARSAFHHSMNYRSVVIYGQAERVDDPDEKLAALHTIVEHVMPGRWADARPPNDKELRATLVLRLPIDEASAKIRTGGALDDDEDLGLPIWAGHVPLRLVAEEPVPAADLDPSLDWPGYALSRVPKLP
ncbi:MAG: pyridoxamine 5'-phosphate oxidase family protein, partial [Acidimicrobiales bacterium]